MATVTQPLAPAGHSEASVVFEGATWSDYEAMLRIIGDRYIFVNEKIQTTGRVAWMKEFRQHVRDNFIPQA